MQMNLFSILQEKRLFSVAAVAVMSAAVVLRNELEKKRKKK